MKIVFNERSVNRKYKAAASSLGPWETYVSNRRADKTFLGRKGAVQAADVPIVDTNISREHCKLFFDDDRLRIEDLNSANGTFVNSKRLGSGGLKHGDTIRQLQRRHAPRQRPPKGKTTSAFPRRSPPPKGRTCPFRRRTRPCAIG